MSRALFLRHGESVSNAHTEAVTLPIAEGDRLTKRGWEQAREAGRALQGLGATHLLVSPMRRAVETAEAVNELLELPLEQLPDVHELREPSGFGEISPEEQMLTRFSVRMAEHAADPDHAPDGAESFNQVLARVQRLKSALEARPDGDLPLIVTHGLFLRFFFFDSVLGEEFEAAATARFWHLRSVNCGLSVFEQGERWHPADAETPGARPTATRAPVIASQVKHEKSERNCRDTGREFYVVKEDWQGSISGVGGCCAAANVERWRSNNGAAHLSFVKYEGQGVFRYDFNGVVQWTVSGVNMGGCSLTGSGTKPVDENNTAGSPGIKLAYGKARYLGTEALNKPFYKIYWSGVDPFGDPCDHSEDGPKNLDFLTINRRRLVFDQKELKGGSGNAVGEGAAWTWDFK